MNRNQTALVILGLAVTAAAVTLSVRAWKNAHTPTTVAPRQVTPDNCCGARMEADGALHTYSVAEITTAPDTVIPVPESCRVEAYGYLMVIRAYLPPGKYNIEIEGSENSYQAAGMRIFNIQTLDESPTTSPATTPATNPAETLLAKNVDLFTLAGGAGKPVILKGTVEHAAGIMKIVFTGILDNAKFSAIRIFDSTGKKVAWMLASDVAALNTLPGDAPVIPGPVLWTDPKSPLDKRVADLLARMTLREKVWQMSHNAPAIPRLGIPAYNYWSEALHGVARNGVATVFPQAIGMAASWDPDLLHTVADTIATEARAKFNGAETSGSSIGLTFWSPNINLFRDPRWGRGHETYGEDPLLTGKMGVAFIRGLQGDDPQYFKVIATAKHFAVHSGPESMRHYFDAEPPQRDFYESYLPQFEMAVREGKVYSVMGAYNRVFGAPACDSPLLLQTLLRDTWGFDGYVVSDCMAIHDIWANHKVVDNQAQAAADAVRAGTDLECGFDYGSLAAAVDLHLITTADIDRALARVFTSRFKLGLFDPPASVKYTAIPESENDTPAHGDLSLKMARESIVLLKNDGILPLKKNSFKKIAVIGPNADGLLGLLGNYNGTPSHPVTVIAGLRAALPDAQIIHIKGCDNADRVSNWQVLPALQILPSWQELPDICLRPSADSPDTGFRAEFFSSDKMDAPIAVRNEKSLDVRGHIDSTIAPPVPSAGTVVPIVAMRYAAEFVAPVAGKYHIGIQGVSGYRLFMGGQKIADHWNEGNGDSLAVPYVPVDLKAGEAVPFVIETHPYGNQLDLRLLWDRGDIDLAPRVADRVKDADLIIFAGGLDGHMEAEEGDVRAPYKGFSGGDRATIELPALQSTLLKALAATGKPIVFVNLSGSAMAMPWEASHLNAIVQAWYPGQSGGTAIADILVGNVNPSGRLPITFYASTYDLPSFTDYAMNADIRGRILEGVSPGSKGRTYRYFTGTPLWPFGFGLSYTTFRYDTMHFDPEVATPDGTVTFTVDVQNKGDRNGDEVVQLYVRQRPTDAAPGDANRRLVGFQRVAVPAGKTTQATISVPMNALRVWNETRKSYEVRPGQYFFETFTDPRIILSAMVTVK